MAGVAKELRAEIERLKYCWSVAEDRLSDASDERDALKAKVEKLEAHDEMLMGINRDLGDEFKVLHAELEKAKAAS